MKTFRRFVNWIKDTRGVATSLIEATATVAVGAVLAGVAVGGAIDAINDSKVQAAIGDVSSIGQGIITFYKDNSFFPLFANGQKTGAGDDFYGFLVSENGTYPTDSTQGTVDPTTNIASGRTWNVPASGSAVAWDVAGYFGHKPDYAGGKDSHSTIEGQLIKNILGMPPSSTDAYPLRGSYNGDPNRGWNGPYISSMPKTDPWGNKYIVNIEYLHPGFLSTISGSNSSLPQIAVIVLSAGPNRNIETPVDQPFNTFKAQGDDIVFRIK
ncbi:MAG TPA: hypothetical protein VKY31_15830 [Terriglobia bacterium]|nr:hypothetical protein [Terriglobia bacterium]